jgi:hypothetical protein
VHLDAPGWKTHGALLYGDVCNNDPLLHALALILARRGGLVASNDTARRDRVLGYCWITAGTILLLIAILNERHSPSKWAQRSWMICCNATFSAAVIGEKPSAAHLEHTTWRPSSCYWSFDDGDGARAQARMLSIFFSIPRLCSCRLWCVPLGEDLGCCRGAFSPSSRPKRGQASGCVASRVSQSTRGCSMITW